MKRLVHHHLGARIVVQILLTRPATVLSSFWFFHVPRKHIYRHIFLFPSKHNQNFPSTFPTGGVFQKFIPPKKTPQKTVAPLLVQGPHHIVLMRWGFSSTPLKVTASPENGTHFNRRFLPLEIFRLNFQGTPIREKLGVIYDFMSIPG